MTDSVPPAMAASASPYWIFRYASPTAWAPVVHAVTVARFGPFSPYLIEMFPAASFTMRPVMKNGEMTRGLLPLSTNSRCVFSISGRPPIPDPTTTAIRSRFSSLTGIPESSIAKRAAAIAKWMNVSIFLISFFSM